MNIKTKETYSEVYSILNMLGDNYKNKIPINLLSMINEERLESYNPQYDTTKRISERNISRDSLSIIALLYLNYWCNTPEEKQNLKQLLRNNEEIHQKETKEKYNTDNLFKVRHKFNKSDNLQEDFTEMVVYKESIFRKILIRLKKFFNP